MYRATGEVSASAVGKGLAVGANLCQFILPGISSGPHGFRDVPDGTSHGRDLRLGYQDDPAGDRAVVTVYSLVGGIIAVIWADAIQVVLLWAVVAVTVILMGMPAGPRQVFELGAASDKFSPGSLQLWSVSQTTIWVLITYGVFENLKNFGIDQSYIQRYVAASSQAEARRGLWLSAGLYVPVSALFFFIGSSLYAYYSTRPQDAHEVRRIVAHQRLMQQKVEPGWQTDAQGQQHWSDDYDRQVEAIAAGLSDADIGDRVFPHFIAAHLPAGVTGLLIAAIFAAGMSTVSTSLNSSATLVMSDFYRPLLAPQASERQLVRVLYGATLAWGLMGTATALALIPLTQSVLDVWWTVSSVLGSGLLGLFLLGVLCRGASSRVAIAAVLLGSLIVAWMIVSPSDYWPSHLDAFRSPFHDYLVIVVGTIAIVVLGFVFWQSPTVGKADR